MKIDRDTCIDGELERECVYERETDTGTEMTETERQTERETDRQVDRDDRER